MTTKEYEFGWDNVIPIRSVHGVQHDAALARIEAYWTEVRAGRLVPARSEIDPRGLEGVLGHAFILERLTTGLAKLRIAGSHMAETLGIEPRGLPLSAIFATGSREALAGALAAVFDEPATVRFSLASDGRFGRPELSGALILLPLRSDLGDITRVLGGLSLSGLAGRAPRRLEITGQSRRSLVGYAARPGKSMDRPSGLTAPASPPNKRLHHLRLVSCSDGI